MHAPRTQACWDKHGCHVDSGADAHVSDVVVQCELAVRHGAGMCTLPRQRVKSGWADAPRAQDGTEAMQCWDVVALAAEPDSALHSRCGAAGGAARASASESARNIQAR